MLAICEDVKVIIAERDDILTQLSEMRKVGVSKEVRRKAVSRVLHLNQLINYNGNIDTNKYNIR